MHAPSVERGAKLALPQAHDLRGCVDGSPGTIGVEVVTELFSRCSVESSRNFFCALRVL